MPDSRSSSRRLVLLVVGLTIISLAVLLWLGGLLLERDRQLEVQEAAESTARATTTVVAAIDRALSAVGDRLSSGATEWPPGAVAVEITAASLHTTPVGRVAYLPVVPDRADPPADLFPDVDVLDARGDAGDSIVALQRLIQSSDSAVQAGALLRLARLERKRGRVNPSRAAYDRLAAMGDVHVAGAPASLVATYGIGALLETLGRPDDVRALGRTLLTDLQRGRWGITSGVYRTYLEDARRWAGIEEQPPAAGEVLAQSIAGLWDRRAGLLSMPPRRSGYDRLATAGDEAIVIWRREADTIRAAIATSEVAWNDWLKDARAVARDQGATVALAAPGTTPFPAIRAVEAHLPWDVFITASPAASLHAKFQTRRRLLIGGFAVTVPLALLASWIIVRGVRREVAMARLKTQFLATVSHEFRTPLTSLRQFTERLREHPELAPADRGACYDVQSRAADRLSELVESLLDFGRLEAGARPFVFVNEDAGAFVRSVVEDFKSHQPHSAGPVCLEIPHDPAPVCVDASMLRRAVSNLLDNAVKYSPEVIDITVSVRRESGQVAIAVRDRGLGIPRAEQSAIFTMFHRGEEAESRAIRGTGLGLAIVREIVGAHHGRVTVQSEPGRGSTFTIWLPASALPERSTVAENAWRRS